MKISGESISFKQQSTTSAALFATKNSKGLNFHETMHRELKLDGAIGHLAEPL